MSANRATANATTTARKVIANPYQKPTNNRLDNGGCGGPNKQGWGGQCDQANESRAPPVPPSALRDNTSPLLESDATTGDRFTGSQSCSQSGGRDETQTNGLSSPNHSMPRTSEQRPQQVCNPYKSSSRPVSNVNAGVSTIFPQSVARVQPAQRQCGEWQLQCASATRSEENCSSDGNRSSPCGEIGRPRKRTNPYKKYSSSAEDQTVDQSSLTYNHSYSPNTDTAPSSPQPLSGDDRVAGKGVTGALIQPAVVCTATGSSSVDMYDDGGIDWDSIPDVSSGHNDKSASFHMTERAPPCEGGKPQAGHLSYPILAHGSDCDCQSERPLSPAPSTYGLESQEMDVVQKQATSNENSARSSDSAKHSHYEKAQSTPIKRVLGEVVNDVPAVDGAGKKLRECLTSQPFPKTSSSSLSRSPPRNWGVTASTSMPAQEPCGDQAEGNENYHIDRNEPVCSDESVSHNQSLGPTSQDFSAMSSHVVQCAVGGSNGGATMVATNSDPPPVQNELISRRNAFKSNSPLRSSADGANDVTNSEGCRSVLSPNQSGLDAISKPEVSSGRDTRHCRSLIPPVAVGIDAVVGESSSSSGQSTYSPGKVNSKHGAPPVAVAGKTLPPLPPDLAYSIDRVLPIEDEHRQTLIKNANISGQLRNGWRLLSHQKAGVLRGLKMRRLILSYDMGLGKTLIACVWSHAFKKSFPSVKVYVIAPVSLHAEWRRTALETLNLKSARETDDPLDMEIASWGKVPKVPQKLVEKYVVVCDEAHYMQSMTSARTKDALRLLREKRCIGALLLTGTPMKNGKPLNLFPLLKAVRHPFGDRQKAFEIHFCAGQEKSYGRRGVVWDANGSSNLSQLNSHIASHVLHMTKEDCLKNLPPKTREYRQIPVSSRFELKHSAAMNELARIQESTGNDSEAVLAAFMKVRHISSLAKVDATVALAKSILETEPSLVIFTNFVAVAKNLHQKLEGVGWNGELLTGETPPKKRQAMVDKFQAGLSPVFVCTFGAGGVGLTLTAASTIILMDRPWTPGEAQQAEDRVRRIGQTKKVKSIWMRAFEVDQKIDDLIEQKQQTSHTVVGGRKISSQDNDKSAGGDPKSQAKISIFQLVKSIAPKDPNSLRGLVGS